jgi:hypothetical protein
VSALALTCVAGNLVWGRWLDRSGVNRILAAAPLVGFAAWWVPDASQPRQGSLHPCLGRGGERIRQ